MNEAALYRALGALTKENIPAAEHAAGIIFIAKVIDTPAE